MPYPYNLYFASIVIHPDYQNSGVLFSLFNAAVEKFLHFGRQEVYIKRMLADAVTLNGKKFCQLFGMQKNKIEQSRFLSVRSKYASAEVPRNFSTYKATVRVLRKSLQPKKMAVRRLKDVKYKYAPRGY